VADKPSETPYLRFGETDRPIMGPAVEIVGNAKALLQLRRQIDRALKDTDRYPLDEASYRDEDEQEYQVVVRRERQIFRYASFPLGETPTSVCVRPRLSVRLHASRRVGSRVPKASSAL
jgi:hypothetical protein